jgi:hypothetical protein
VNVAPTSHTWLENDGCQEGSRSAGILSRFHPVICWDWYRLRHRRDDEPIADICDVALKKYKNLCAIDISAYVGDTAALMVRSNASRFCASKVTNSTFHFLGRI